MTQETDNKPRSKAIYLWVPLLLALLGLGAAVPTIQMNLQMSRFKDSETQIIYDSYKDLPGLPRSHRILLLRGPETTPSYRQFRYFGWEIYRHRSLYWDMQGVSQSSPHGYDLIGIKAVSIGDGQDKPTVLHIYFLPDDEKAKKARKSKRPDYFKLTISNSKVTSSEGLYTGDMPLNLDKKFK